MRIATLLSLLLLPVLAFAESGDVVTEEPVPAGPATIVIEQVALAGVQGSWLLSLPDHSRLEGSADAQTIADTPSGNYVFYGVLPNGTVSTIRIYKNGVLDNLFERSQTPFAVAPGDTVRIVIHYHLDRTGTAAVKSDPAGVTFTLSGPDGITFTDITPQTYEDLPEGQYKVQYESFGEGCVKPAPKAGQLVEDGRVSFDIRFECDSATKVRDRMGKDAAKYLTIVTDGNEVQLQDVLQKDWFSTYVFNAAKRDILSGYRDEAGAPTGLFGPGNSVTVAELSKIAHRMAGLSEEAFATDGPWFAAFIASSRGRGWTIYVDGTIDPTRSATRAEVVVTLLQAFDVPLRWQKGNAFTDVTVSTPYAAAIETAANDTIIAGRTDEDGESTGIFDPDAPITRAEIAKIITTMLDTYDSPSALRNAASRTKD